MSEEYFGINPKGVVPTLVHDGRVVIGSNDILVYIEEELPEPDFRAVSDDRQAEIEYWLQQSGDLHLPAIKTFQYYKINAALLPKTEEEEALYNKLQKDPDMLAFHGKYSQGKNFTEDDADGAIALLDAAFVKMNEAISDGDYIVGDTYTLADTSWSPSITSLISDGFDFWPYPEIKRWYETILQRPQFHKAVIEWRKRATDAAGVDPTMPSPVPAAQKQNVEGDTR